MKESLKTRNKIIKAAIELLMKKDATGVTVREIAARAGVAVSAINYHFQSKEILLDISVKETLGKEISHWQSLYQDTRRGTREILRILARRVSDFMAEYPAISQIAIHSDYFNPESGEDIFSRATEALLPLLEKHFAGRKNHQEIKVIAHQLVACIQVSFLRADALKKISGLDFYNETDRYELVDIIDTNLLD